MTSDEVPPVADHETGEIRVMAQRCATCILNPAQSRIALTNERIRQFVDQTRARQGHVVCHRTLPGVAPEGTQAAMCRGFTDAYGMPMMARAAVDAGIARVVEQTDRA